MPRPPRPTSLTAELTQMAMTFASAVTRVVKADTARRVSSLFDAFGDDEAPAAPAASAPRGAGRPRRKAPAKVHGPAHCVYPGCTNPHRGPRFRFLCDDHKNISKAERARLGIGRDMKKPGASGAPATPEAGKAPPAAAKPKAKRRKRRAGKATAKPVTATKVTARAPTKTSRKAKKKTKGKAGKAKAKAAPATETKSAPTTEAAAS